ncbi:MAG TPA: hypothetical protein VKM55_19110 [Candidatus Lokiarchaeia archaeon]|nr:hypothetical protein [Candidatus Lokiarchaeia archaeon]
MLFGVGSGLIADEFGLLLTFGNYWTTLTYTVVAVLLVVLCLLYYFVRHASTLHAHFARMSRNEAFFMLGAFLAIIAGTFLSTMYDNAVVFTAALVLAIAAVAVLVYPIYNHLAQRRITAPKPESD